MCEDIDMETPIKGSSLDLDESPAYNFAEQPVGGYQKGVTLYTARDLAKPKDILAAFYGMGKLLCGSLDGESVFGLPSSHFDLALLWEPHDAPTRRPPGSSQSFPSWSWCGWGEREMEYKSHIVTQFITEHLHHWLMRHTWISWYIRDCNGALRLVWDPHRSGDAPPSLERDQQGYTRNNPRATDHYGRELSEDLVGRERSHFHKTIPEFPVQVQTLPPGGTSARPAARPDRSILQFWTWSAYFYLSYADDMPACEGFFHQRFSILDGNRMWAGSIVLDKRWRFDSQQPQHFIAISEANDLDAAETNSSNTYRTTTQKKSWPLFHVLLLGYDEMNQQWDPHRSASGDHTTNESLATNEAPTDSPDCPIAYRVGLGKVYQDAFVNSCETAYQPFPKTWREIVLG